MRSHGTFSCYLGGCRCTPCIEAQREYFRDYRRRKKGEESRPLFLISSGDLTNVPVAGENWRAAIASAFRAAPAGTMLGNLTKIRRQGSKQVLFTLTMGILEEFDLLERPSDQDLRVIVGSWTRGELGPERQNVKYPDFNTLWAVTSLGAKQYPFRGHLAGSGPPKFLIFSVFPPANLRHGSATLHQHNFW